MVKQIPCHPDYAVSDNGDVYKITPTGLRQLKKDISNGYPRVKLDGHKEYVSYLVAGQYLNPPDRVEQNLYYIDGDPSNCSKDNLVWLNPSEIQRYSTYSVEYRRKVLRGRA